MGPEQLAIKSCDRCVRKEVCILYHGYGQLELRFGIPSPASPEEIISRLSEALANKCAHYMEVESKAEE